MIDRIELDAVDLKESFADEGCREGNDCEHYVGGTVVYNTTDVRCDNPSFTARLLIASDGVERDAVIDVLGDMDELAGLFTGYELVNSILGRKGRVAKLEYQQIDGFEAYDARNEPEYHEYPLPDGSADHD